MVLNPEKQQRRSIRLKKYNYSQPGYYFITACTQNRQCLFGEIDNNIMKSGGFGNIVKDTWNDLPNHNYNILLDSFVIMPNHIHGIIQFVGAGSKPAQSGKNHPLSEIVRQFKTFSARRINKTQNKKGFPIWQRNYYEHIIRNESELDKTRKYIVDNPVTWTEDKDNPINFR